MQVVEHPALEKKEVRVIEPQIQGLGEKEKLTSGAQQSKEKSKERKSLNAKVRKTADTNCNGIEDPTRLKIDKGEGLLGADSPENREEMQKDDGRREETESERREKKKSGKPGAEEEDPSEKKDQVAELQQRLDCKEKEAEELRHSVQKMIEEKSKQMSVLIMSVGQIEDSQIQRQKEVSKIEAEIEMLNIRKTEILQESEAADKEMKKLEKKKKKLEDFQHSYTTETKTKLKKLHTEIDSLQGMLSNPERTNTDPAPPDPVTNGSPELLRFIERQIEDVEKELECPVCLETASQAPIFKCEEDHLICSKCREKVSCCPVCRMEYPRGARKRLRGAERQAERLAGMYNERESFLKSQ